MEKWVCLKITFILKFRKESNQLLKLTNYILRLYEEILMDSGDVTPDYRMRSKGDGLSSHSR